MGAREQRAAGAERYRRTQDEAKSKVRSARAEHEDRTGMVGNMLQLGWTARKWAKNGRPVLFTKRFGEWLYHIKSAKVDGTEWRAEVWTGLTINPRPGVSSLVMNKVEGPRLRGPVQLATWLAVEIANGCVRIDQSKSPARSAGAVLRDDPPEPKDGGDGDFTGR